MLFKATAPNGVPIWLGSGELLLTIDEISDFSGKEVADAIEWASKEWTEAMSDELAETVVQECHTLSWEGLKSEIALWRTGYRPKGPPRGRPNPQKRFERIKKKLKTLLSERDGMICLWPGCKCTENLVIDHIVPLSKNGSDELGNLQLLCARHNSMKGTKIWDMKQLLPGDEG